MDQRPGQLAGAAAQPGSLALVADNYLERRTDGRSRVKLKSTRRCLLPANVRSVDSSSPPRA
jgi:hypothetical protein